MNKNMRDTLTYLGLIFVFLTFTIGINYTLYTRGDTKFTDYMFANFLIGIVIFVTYSFVRNENAIEDIKDKINKILKQLDKKSQALPPLTWLILILILILLYLYVKNK